MAVILDIADSIVAQLNGGSFSQPLTAERHYQPKFDLSEMTAEISYPEWDYRKGRYLENYTNVLAVPAENLGERSALDSETQSLVRKMRRQFEVLRMLAVGFVCPLFRR